MGDDKVVIELELIANQLRDGLIEIKEKLDGIKSTGKNSVGEIAEGAFIAEAAMKALELAAEAAKFAIEQIGEGVKLAAEKEQDINQLNLAMRNVGQYSAEASEAMIRYAETLEKTSTFSSNAVIQAETLARQYSQSTDETMKLTKAAVELSAATGVSLDSAVAKLGQSLSGFGTHLNRLIPGIQNFTEGQLRAGAALDFVLRRYGGSASQQINTFQGRVINLKNAWDQFLESIGKIVTESPLLNRFIEMLSDGFHKAAEMVNDFVKNGGVDKIIHSLISFAQAVNTYVVTPLEYAYNVAKLFFDFVATGASVLFYPFAKLGNIIIQSIIPPFQESLNFLVSIVEPFSQTFADKLRAGIDKAAGYITGTTQKLSDDAGAIVDNWVKKTNDDASHLFETPFADNLAKQLESVDQSFTKIQKKQTDFSNQSAADLTRYSKTIENIVQHGLIKTMSTGVQAIGAALVQGSSAFQDFGKVILGVIGDVSIQIGENLVAQGMAINALSTALASLNGGAAIAAGLALIALGGALKAISGASAVSAAGGAAAGGGYTSNTPQVQQKDMQHKQAQIVINGDYLNSRETANHLAEVLRQNSDITDYTITAQGKQYA